MWTVFKPVCYKFFTFDRTLEMTLITGNMIIDKINIQNFRGIPELKIEDCKTINLFFGKNNCGKTTILEAIFLTIGYSNPSLILNIHAFRNLLFNTEDDLRFIFTNQDFAKPIHIKLDCDNETTFSLNIKPRSSCFEGNSIKVDKDQTFIVGKDKYNTVLDTHKMNELRYDIDIKEHHKQSKHSEASLLIERGELSLRVPKNQKAILKGVFVTQTLDLPANLRKELEEIFLTKKQTEIISILQAFDPAIQGLFLGDTGMVYVDVGQPRLLPQNLMGDGFRRILMIVLALYNAKDGFLLLDEIENGFHFSALSTLWKIIIKAANVEKPNRLTTLRRFWLTIPTC
jgi:AAA15 family ATPase/GTPase